MEEKFFRLIENLKMMKINGLILAAGLSSRINAFKPLKKINGKTLIETVAELMFTSEVYNIVVVLGYRGDEIETVFRNSDFFDRIKFVYNKNYAIGDMLESVKTGVKAMPKCSAFFLALADMPAVSKDTFIALSKTFTDETKVVFPTLDGRRKHPVLISYDCCDDILNYNSGEGLRGIWKNYNGHIIELPLEDPGCGIDIDIYTDFEDCRDYMLKYIAVSEK